MDGNYFDRMLVSGANNIVSTWSWFTGLSKRDLANTLGIVGNSLYACALPAFTPIAIFSAYLSLNMDKRIELLERLEQDSPVKDYELMRLKNGTKRAGMINFGIAGLEGLHDLGSSNPNELIAKQLSIGFFLNGIGNIVMLADETPRRKDFVRRGFDKLTEIVRDYQAKPALKPVYVTN